MLKNVENLFSSPMKTCKYQRDSCKLGERLCEADVNGERWDIYV